MKYHPIKITPAVLWFTGLSGSGKSTLTQAINKELLKVGVNSSILDGDALREDLCKDLGFSVADRQENIRRAGATARLLVDSGVFTLAALITPFQQDRKALRRRFRKGTYFEVYCDSPLKICEQRDKKGLYQQARSGNLANFTGISSPYEIPQEPDLVLNTGSDTVSSCVENVMDFLIAKQLIHSI